MAVLISCRRISIAGFAVAKEAFVAEVRFWRSGQHSAILALRFVAINLLHADETTLRRVMADPTSSLKLVVSSPASQQPMKSGRPKTSVAL